MKTFLNLKSEGKKPNIQRKNNEGKNFEKTKKSSKSDFSYGIKHEHRHGNKECRSMYQSRICSLKL